MAVSTLKTKSQQRLRRTRPIQKNTCHRLNFKIYPSYDSDGGEFGREIFYSTHFYEVADSPLKLRQRVLTRPELPLSDKMLKHPWHVTFGFYINMSKHTVLIDE